MPGYFIKDDNLKLFRPAELAEKLPPVRPLIRGIAARGTFGPFGGKHKTLKSYSADGFALAVAGGKPAFGFPAWGVPEALPVLKFAGEGGSLNRRRLQRIAAEVYSIEDIATIPMYLIDGVAGMNSDELIDSLTDAVEEIKKAHKVPPGLVYVDSLYNYHDPNIEVSNIYERGRMLSDFQHTLHRIAGPDCVLWLVDHFRKVTRGLDLDEYQQSGMGAWADSWWNAEHREEGDLDNQMFKLNVEVGSRHGYAGLYEVDFDLGPFDEAEMEWERPMQVEVRRVREHARKSSGSGKSDADIERGIYELVDNGGKYTKSQLKTKVSGTNARVQEVIEKLIQDRHLTLKKENRQEHNRTFEREFVVRVGKLRAD